jgi:2-dehydro-3-deoxyphosphogalactonate aldolase
MERSLMQHQRFTQFKSHLKHLPLIAILRGVQTHEVCTIGQLLFDRGLRIIEVPMNSPNAIESIQCLKAFFMHQSLPVEDQPIIGAGTVTTVKQVQDLAAVGCDLIISPHLDSAVVQATLQQSLISLPGVCTPSEAFLALKEGAHGLKCFPAISCPPSYIKAIRAVLDKDVLIFSVGGVGLDQFSAYRQVGTTGFGLGSLVYTKGDSLEQINQKMNNLLKAWHSLE